MLRRRMSDSNNCQPRAPALLTPVDPPRSCVLGFILFYLASRYERETIDRAWKIYGIRRLSIDCVELRRTPSKKPRICWKPFSNTRVQPSLDRSVARRSRDAE